MLTLAEKYNRRTVWMKMTEVARYWAAKELTHIQRTQEGLSLAAPFASPKFTLQIAGKPSAVPTLHHGDHVMRLTAVREQHQLDSATFITDDEALTLCIDLPKGKSTIRF